MKLFKWIADIRDVEIDASEESHALIETTLKVNEKTYKKESEKQIPTLLGPEAILIALFIHSVSFSKVGDFYKF